MFKGAGAPFLLTRWGSTFTQIFYYYLKQRGGGEGGVENSKVEHKSHPSADASYDRKTEINEFDPRSQQVPFFYFLLNL